MSIGSGRLTGRCTGTVISPNFLNISIFSRDPEYSGGTRPGPGPGIGFGEESEGF